MCVKLWTVCTSFRTSCGYKEMTILLTQVVENILVIWRIFTSQQGFYIVWLVLHSTYELKYNKIKMYYP